MIGLSLLLAAAAPCVGPVCNFDTLSPYFAKLAAARAARGKPPVHILQIGDSHTAGDVLTGGWRELLQAQYGNGGRGVLPPGKPYDGYFTRGVTVTMSGWQVASTFGKGSTVPRPPLGLSSYSLTPVTPNASFALIAEPAMAFDRLVICALAGPGVGGLDVGYGDQGQGEHLDFTADAPTPRCATTRWERPSNTVFVTASGAPVTITSWATFRDDGGVVLSNLGVVGSQLQHFARTDDAVLAEELRAYAPDLIVLAFGTNEGFGGPSIDAAAYEATLRTQIARLRRLAPDVPILLLGPPDALSRREELRGGQGNCPVIPGVVPVFAPPGLAQVRAVQRKVAADLHIAWWDWQARMGGLCAAERWVGRNLMRGDYVHFRSEGGAQIARLLQDDLEQAEREVRR